MIKFTLTSSTYEFDAQGYSRAMKAYLEKQARLAAAEFAKAALARIPVRSGFVSGSFGTLTDLIGSGARFNPIVSAVRRIIKAGRSLLGKKEKQVSANGLQEYYTGGGGKILKTTTSGRAFATPTNDILKWEGNKLIFNYQVDITYFSFQDNASGPSPTAPWGAFLAGQAAFEDYMERVGLLAIPKLEDYLTPKTIKHL